MYLDGGLYISNAQDNNEAMKDDIVHEISHSLEYRHGDIIYGDSKVEQEFLGKRNRLYHMLKAEAVPVDMSQFLVSDYSLEFDDYLYNKIGYEKLANLIMGLFVSPYSVTSIREYFATAFEEYILSDKHHVAQVCPKVYEKILLLVRFDGR